MNKKAILNYIEGSANVINSLNKQVDEIKKISNCIKTANKKNKKILVCGNGGSCADAEHFVTELTCTYSSSTRKPFSAISISSSPSAITAWSNDFNFLTYLQRQVTAHGKKDDILFLISTGGADKKHKYSMNLFNAAKEGKKRGMKLISLVGKSGGELYKLSNYKIKVKSNKTSFIQETHKVIMHLICELIER